jgi:hypothetical protein
MYENAQYDAEYVDQPDGGKVYQNVGIIVYINGAKSYVPLDPANTDYANMMQLVAEGKLVIAPAD